MNKRQIVVTGLAGLSGALAGVAAWLIPSSRKKLTPAERERRRRFSVNARGRTGSAMIVDYRDGVVGYIYSVGGLEYTAFQDLSALRELLPADPATLIATPATLKYLASNPANSIVLCEEWSGVRFHPQATAP